MTVTFTGDWISVKDSFPELLQGVLVFLNGKRHGIGFGYLRAGNEWYQDGWDPKGSGPVPFDTDVTYWMPLPEPPKDD